MELRKVQLTGGATFAITLPKSWAQSVGLEPGDQVALAPQPDMSLLVVPKGEFKPEKITEAAIEFSPTEDPEAIVTDFIARYLVGYDVIRIRQRAPEHRALIKEAIRRKLIGVEVIEESADDLVIQCLLSHAEFQAKKALTRMSLIASSMYRDAISSLRDNDRALAQEVVERDDEVDRFYHFMVRQLKKAVRDRPTLEEIGLSGPRDCLGYRLIAKSVERAADHAARIAGTVPILEEPIGSDVMKHITSIGATSNEIYECALEALNELDTELAHRSMAKTRELAMAEQEFGEKLLKLKLSAKTIVGLRLILESLRRIAEYGADIAEIVINLAVSEP